jgi:hypothetical protein
MKKESKEFLERNHTWVYQFWKSVEDSPFSLLMQKGAAPENTAVFEYKTEVHHIGWGA